jgi:hypothetical protein
MIVKILTKGRETVIRFTARDISAIGERIEQYTRRLRVLKDPVERSEAQENISGLKRAWKQLEPSSFYSAFPPKIIRSVKLAEHAEVIFLDDQTILLRDLGSPSGTFVEEKGGKLIRSEGENTVEIFEGQVVVSGGARFRLVNAEAKEADQMFKVLRPKPETIDTGSSSLADANREAMLAALSGDMHTEQGISAAPVAPSPAPAPAQVQIAPGEAQPEEVPPPSPDEVTEVEFETVGGEKVTRSLTRGDILSLLDGSGDERGYRKRLDELITKETSGGSLTDYEETKKEALLRIIGALESSLKRR